MAETIGAAREPTAVEAGRGDLRPLSEVLARAFETDPVHRWILPSDLHWPRRAPRMFSALLRERIRHGGVLTTSDCRGAALWYPPEQAHPFFGDRVALSLRMLLVLGNRAPEIGRSLGEVVRHRPREPHWYLSVLGTDPQHQGGGVASSLLRPVLERCDADELPAYLESSKPENVPFYERHGFKVVRQVDLAGGPPVWAMLRRVR